MTAKLYSLLYFLPSTVQKASISVNKSVREVSQGEEE